MAGDDPYLDQLLARLQQSAGAGASGGAAMVLEADEYPEPAAAETAVVAKPVARPATGSRAERPKKSSAADKAAPETRAPFVPLVPASLAAAQLNEAELESIILKFLLFQIDATGRQVADQVKLPFALVEKLLFQLKADQMVVHKRSAALGDYLYTLTEAGHQDARRAATHSTYCGAAPVHIDEYIASVRAQSVRNNSLTMKELHDAFQGMRVDPALLNQVGQALQAGTGFFIFGSPGNGKTSIAERVGRAYGRTVWIPRAIGVDGEIIRLYDVCKHVEVPVEPHEKEELSNADQRWVRILRPTIVVGGELTLERLEITTNANTGTSEAPLQLKSNCGTLVIDDFGRQRCSTRELLNRWIVPLDKRVDYLNLPSGKSIEVPFDQLLIFSTNLEPKDLVDEAFLRRIPYKIEVFDPSEADFRRLCQDYAKSLDVAYSQAAIDYLIAKHYRSTGRPFRFCHARDLLLHVRNFCKFNQLPIELSPEGFDVAVRNYFAVMGS